MILTKIMFTHKQMDNRAARFGYIHRAVISFDVISFQQKYPDIKVRDGFLSNPKIDENRMDTKTPILLLSIKWYIFGTS